MTRRVVLLLLALGTGEARHLRPGDDGAQGKQDQQLAASGAASGAAAEANPEVDAWHDRERARIEEECDEMLRKLDEEKRAKLQAIVDQRQKELDEELRRLAAAQEKARCELEELQKQEAEAEAECAKVPPKKSAIGTAEGDRQKWEAEVRRLKELIAKKRACLDELAQAEAELRDAEQKLCEAKKLLADKEAEYAANKQQYKVEQGHVTREKADVAAAEDDLAKARARLAALEKRLAKAEGDLREHDEATHAKSSDVAKKAAPADEKAPTAPAAQTETPKSSARHAPVSYVGFLLLAGAFFW